MNSEDVTFIIPVFNLKTHRINNLKFILPYILNTKCRVLVVEQIDGDKSNISEILKKIEGVEHLFFNTSEKRFHKTGLINWAVVHHVKTKYAWINDVDYYMKFQSVLDSDWNEKFIQPYSIAKKLSEIDSNNLLSGKSINVDYSEMSSQYISMYGALSFIFDVNEFTKNRGMDESVYGWGYEDMEFSARIKKKYEIQKIELRGIHLWHPVETIDVSTVHNLEGASVVIICHDKYLEKLPASIKAIDEQSKPFVKKILSLDSCNYAAPFGWTVISNNNKNPNATRNAGLSQVASEWVIFWDADNLMPKNYHAEMYEQIKNAESNVAFLYPSIIYVNEYNTVVRILNVPEWDYWKFREKTFVDTSSAWRTFALQSVGGWSDRTVACDDYELSIRLTRNWWKGKKANVYSQITFHSDSQRSRKNKDANIFWNIWNLGIVTLWGDRSAVISDVINWYRHADIPPDTSIYWVNNTNDRAKTKMLLDAANELKSRYKSITFVEAGIPYSIGKNEAYLTWARHQHVANLYNDILSKVSEDLVLFVEDDNIAPFDGLRKLHDELTPIKHDPETVGFVGGAYRARTTPQYVCGATSKTAWQGVLDFDSLPDTPIQIGVMGGGFTLYRNSALRKALPLMCTKHIDSNRLIHGWDGNLGIKLNQLGYKLLMHCGVRVEHKCEEVIEWEKKEILAKTIREENMKNIPTEEQYNKLVASFPWGFRPDQAKMSATEGSKSLYSRLISGNMIRGKFLDYGCGTGRLAYSCILNGVNYTGLECDKNSVNFCRAVFPTGTFIHLDIKNKMYNPDGKKSINDLVEVIPDNEFDSIAALSVLTHTGSPEEGESLIKQLARVLKPEGIALITAFSSPPNPIFFGESRTCYDVEWLKTTFEKYFTITAKKGGETTNTHDQIWYYLQKK